MTKNKGSLSKKSPWKAIQKKIKPERPASIISQESHQTMSSTETNDEKPKPREIIRSSQSSTASNDVFEDALSLKEDQPKKDETHHPQQEIESEAVESKEPMLVEQAPEKAEPTRMSLILPALQSYESSDDDSDKEEEEEEEKHMDASTEQTNQQGEVKEKEILDPLKQTEEKKLHQSSIAEVEALEIASLSSPSKPSRPITYEPIPIERPWVSTDANEKTNKIQVIQLDHIAQDDLKEQANIPSNSSSTTEMSEENPETPTQEETETNQNEPNLVEKHDAVDEQINLKTALAEENSAPAATEELAIQKSASDTNDNVATEANNDTTKEETEKVESLVAKHLAAILPAVEESVKAITEEQSKLPKPSKKHSQISEEEHQRASRSREFERSIEDPIDLDTFKDNTIVIQAIDPKDIPANNLKPHEQEIADEPIRKAMNLLFDNKFMKAKSIFQTKASIDPLYALGLGAMAFIKAYTIAKTQVDNTSFKKPFKSTVSQYFSTLVSTNTGLPNNPPSFSMPNSSGGLSDPSAFLPNGVLRAHVVKAECCLLMGILHMTQESVVGYVKCGLNIRRGNL
ncbi:hypothetical protein BD560DRAFT_456251 [Blakeslea trispora]|nr:hypothetical protein BD560DRAFT_456251 [Blakeslea trispora]